MFESPQAMANAMLSGQIDLASNAGSVAARTAETRPNAKVPRRRDDMAMPIVEDGRVRPAVLSEDLALGRS